MVASSAASPESLDLGVPGCVASSANRRMLLV
jgi:hypothetical protein